MVFVSVPTLLFIALNFETASIPRKKDTFSVHVRLTVLELASLENEEERRAIFGYLKFVFSASTNLR